MKVIKTLILLIVLIIFLAFVFSGCGGGDLNLPPDTPNNPTPADGSLDIPVDTKLSWNCSDPDDDPLKYDIFFGTSNPPQNLVQNDFQSTTYDPGILNYSTTYYWKIVAKDTAGATTSGPVWSFTTTATPNTPPNSPYNPVPSDGATGISLDVVLSWQCDDPDGDSLSYDLYFGTSTTPPLVAQNLNNANYDPNNLKYETTYYWKVVAKDTFDATASGPVWSFTTRSRLNWKYKTDGEIFSSPAVDSGVIYIGSDDDYLYSISNAGNLIWRYRSNGFIDSSPSIGNDGTIYFGSWDFRAYALNSDGSFKWLYNTGFYIDSSPAIDKNGFIYIGSNDGKLYALTPNGSKTWHFETVNSDYIYSSPAIDASGTIYFGDYGGYLYALNPDGSLKWRYQTGGSIYSSPAIGNDGTIYFGSFDWNLYALNPDGTLKWKYKTGSSVGSSPATMELYILVATITIFTH